MNIVQLSTRALAVTAFLGLSAAPAVASTCTTNNRTAPANFGSDSVAMSCDSAAGAVTSAINAISNVNGTFTLSPNFTGPVGQSAVVQLLNAAGTVICTQSDTTSGGGPNNLQCIGIAGGVRWRGIINHNL